MLVDRQVIVPRDAAGGSFGAVTGPESAASDGSCVFSINKSINK